MHSRRAPAAPADLSLTSDPVELFELAWSLEPAMRLIEQVAVLDRIGELLANGGAAPAPPGRDWATELLAERALYAARMNELTAAHELAEQVLSSPAASAVAVARATDAAGRAHAWAGTAAATRQADRLLAEAAERYQSLGASEWLGFVMFWRANSVYLQTGVLDRARELMLQALAVLQPRSPRRAAVLTFLADVLTSLGQWAEVEKVLAEAMELADHDDNAAARGYAAWSWARVASARMDAMGTERWIRECEREAVDWRGTHVGVTFLADAAELLDRVGLGEEAARYLLRAQQRDPGDEFVRQAHAALLARGGDPGQALDALQGLMRGDWLEKRLLWRHSLLGAWATFRAGRDGAGQLAAVALEQAERAGGVRVALNTEPELTRALAPLAATAGSDPARSLLLGDTSATIQLFGRPRVLGPDGVELPVPPGQPAELIRLLAVHPDGLLVERVIDTVFPGVAIGPARNRLRQVLARLRAVVDDLVVREGDRLRLRPVWVDVREFVQAADRARAARGPRAVQLAYTGLALWSGPPLPDDAYSGWASEIRSDLEHRHLSLLDIVIADAERRGSHQEAVAALSASLEHAPYEHERYETIAGHLLALGRHATAHHLARIVGVDLKPSAD